MRTLLIKDYFYYSKGFLIISDIFKSPVMTIFFVAIEGNLLYLLLVFDFFTGYLLFSFSRILFPIYMSPIFFLGPSMPKKFKLLKRAI
jgi:hypothetical protein